MLIKMSCYLRGERLTASQRETEDKHPSCTVDFEIIPSDATLQMTINNMFLFFYPMFNLTLDNNSVSLFTGSPLDKMQYEQ